MIDNAMWVLCGDCEHKWIAVHLPMTVEKFVAIMKQLICPNCAKTDKIYICEGL